MFSDKSKELPHAKGEIYDN